MLWVLSQVNRKCRGRGAPCCGPARPQRRGGRVGPGHCEWSRFLSGAFEQVSASGLAAAAWQSARPPRPLRRTTSGSRPGPETGPTASDRRRATPAHSLQLGTYTFRYNRSIARTPHDQREHPRHNAVTSSTAPVVHRPQGHLPPTAVHTGTQRVTATIRPEPRAVCSCRLGVPSPQRLRVQPQLGGHPGDRPTPRLVLTFQLTHHPHHALRQLHRVLRHHCHAHDPSQNLGPPPVE